MQLGQRCWFGRTTKRESSGSLPAARREKTRGESAFSEGEPYSRSRYKDVPMEVRAIFIVVSTSGLLCFMVHRRIVWVIIPHTSRTKTHNSKFTVVHKKNIFVFFAHNSKLTAVRFCALASELMKIGTVEVLREMPPFSHKNLQSQELSTKNAQKHKNTKAPDKWGHYTRDT